jgi:4,4'-diaponeurosporenoate glycosyltransferase
VEIRLLVVLAGWSAAWWLLWRPTRVDGEPRAHGRRRATIGVVIPARDEATRLPGLLTSLARQSPPADQVVVVDDRSRDATAEVAAGFGVEVVAGHPVPDGWVGKPWACHQGAARVATDAVVFLDADVELGDDGLAAVADALERRGGLVSVEPYHRVVRPYERLSALCNVVSMMGSGAASPGRRGRSRAAFGPVLASRRTDYDAVGGHAAVRGEITEDIGLARSYRAAGLPVSALTGGDAVTFRMYPDGVGQLVEGWSKNLATGAASVVGPRLIAIVVWVTALLLSLVLVVTASWPVALAVYLLFALQLLWMQRQLGRFGVGTALAYPVAAVVFVAIFVRSLWLTAWRRRVTWRGRSIDVPPAIDGVEP